MNSSAQPGELEYRRFPAESRTPGCWQLRDLLQKAFQPDCTYHRERDKMSKMNLLFLKRIHFMVWVHALLVCLGCTPNNSPQSPEQTTNIQELSISSEEDINRLLSTGMSTNEIVSLLGAPDVVRGSDELQQWIYKMAPFRSSKYHTVFITAISIVVTNGNLNRFDLSFVEVPPPSTTLNTEVIVNNASGSNACVLGFYRVHSEPIEGGRHFDTDQFPKLGYVRQTPDLIIEKVSEVTLEEILLSDENIRNWTFAVRLADDERRKLETFTRAHLDQTVLLMINGKPAMSTTILMPISSDLALNFTNEADVQQVKVQFRNP
jgi:hypothetical protein